jgi:hypothetical protein
MLFFIAGSPGRFADLCSTIVLQLVEKVLGPGERIRGDTPEEITRNLLLSTASHSVVTSFRPGGRIVRSLATGSRPFVVALENPRTSLFDLIVLRGIALPTATRLVANSCASLSHIGKTAGGLVLKADQEGGDRTRLATAIANHFGLDVAHDDVSEIVCNLGKPDDGLEDKHPPIWWDALDQSEQRIVIGALGPFLDHFPGRAPETITWSRELFFIGDQSSEHVRGEIDITGRARCLLRGPEILLPPGTWSVTAHLEISPDAAENSYVLEATAGVALSRTVIRPAAGGAVEANLSLALSELPDRPLELRLYNERPAFGGHISLSHITAIPSPP